MEKSATPTTSKSTSKKKKTGERTFVLDTSVLLSDPRAIFRFAEHQVVLPVVVISELEKKRHDPEIGYFARQALRNLDELRSKHERLDFPISVGEGGSLRVELNHSNQSVLPSGLQLGDNDSRILSVALNFSNEASPSRSSPKTSPCALRLHPLDLLRKSIAPSSHPNRAGPVLPRWPWVPRRWRSSMTPRQ